MASVRHNVRLFAAMLCAVLAAEVTSSHAWVAPHRGGGREEAPLRLRALPGDVTLYPGSSVAVSCRVRVASWAMRSLHIGFYVRLNLCFNSRSLTHSLPPCHLISYHHKLARAHIDRCSAAPYKMLLKWNNSNMK